MIISSGGFCIGNDSVDVSEKVSKSPRLKSCKIGFSLKAKSCLSIVCSVGNVGFVEISTDNPLIAIPAPIAVITTDQIIAALSTLVKYHRPAMIDFFVRCN